jgi:hypothetical protein
MSAGPTWLSEARCSHVAMEATGVYWTPVWKILSDGEFDLLVANAAHIKNVPGRKAFTRGVRQAQTQAAIVNLSSAAGIRGVPNRLLYVALPVFEAGRMLAAIEYDDQVTVSTNEVDVYRPIGSWRTTLQPPSCRPRMPRP